eukprot:CAMPEP_0197659432 /NCGR_PEP_ID=MMETSP1338-20131121/47628_1 /TAXON_ID=43686 ORGANISM="Pelagodinium beii, Strain RCC1491" /NCGR_SAMPLE_ID=MMETSP1338 /ASSEMBLY_ACC=CAM_ASM_000754 /LENGTH=37 /DNA_ID= /DNA_START= /DNA_END= /DNA_ORIENTATION=
MVWMSNACAAGSIGTLSHVAMIILFGKLVVYLGEEVD